MTRAPRGQRAYGSVRRNTAPNTTLIAALTVEGIGPSLVLEGGVDTNAFVVYVEQVLAPTLRLGQIVVLDNVSVHKNPQVQAAIRARGGQLWFLPIELAFAKVKEALRRAKVRPRDALEDTSATALDTITPSDARACFKHCGYRVAPDWVQLFPTLL
jgi:transposase